MKKAVIIRISKNARKRIKIQAIKNEATMIDTVEELSKLTVPKKSVAS